MNQILKSAVFLMATAGAAFACTHACGAANNGGNSAQNVPPPNGPAIYKIVDASGRVTYTNAPTKGAAKVELDPITVIPATPAGVLGGSKVASQAGVPFVPAASPSASPELIPVGVAPTIAVPELPTPAPAPIATVAPTFAASLRANPNQTANQPATAVVTPIGKPAPVLQASLTKLPVVKLSPPANDQDLSPASAAPPATTPTATPVTTLSAFVAPTAQLASSALVAVSVPTLQQRSVARSAESKLQPNKIDEQELQLAAAKEKLDDEHRASASFRALRARLPATIDQSNPAKAAIQNDIKAQVEEHFERIRHLQDEISLHEQNLAALRQTTRPQVSSTLSSVANSTARR